MANKRNPENYLEILDKAFGEHSKLDKLLHGSPEEIESVHQQEVVDLAAMDVFFEGRVKPPSTRAEHVATACMSVFTLAAKQANDLGQPRDGEKLLKLMDAIQEFYHE